MKKERLRKYWEYKGYKSAKAFAAALGISDSHIAEVDQRVDNRKLLLALRSKSECYDLNIDWFETGEGEMLLEPDHPHGKEKFKQFSETVIFGERPENYPDAEMQRRLHVQKVIE